MPKAAPTPSPEADHKPYDRASSPVTPTKSKKASPVPWTAADRLKLFEAVCKRGVSTKAFEGVIEERSSKQCYDIWMKTVAPGIKKSLAGSK